MKAIRHLKVVRPTNEKRTVDLPVRKPNSEYRTREHLTRAGDQETHQGSRGYPGQTEECQFTYEDNVVTLVSHAGVPLRNRKGTIYTKKVETGESPALVASRLVK